MRISLRSLCVLTASEAREDQNEHEHKGGVGRAVMRPKCGDIGGGITGEGVQVETHVAGDAVVGRAG